MTVSSLDRGRAVAPALWLTAALALSAGCDGAVAEGSAGPAPGDAAGGAGDGGVGGSAAADPCTSDGKVWTRGCLVSLAAEGLSEDDVVTDIDLLIGTTFTLPGLCPDNFCVHDEYDSDAGSSLTFHLERASLGRMELLSSPQTRGQTMASLTLVEPRGLSFESEGVVTCAAICAAVGGNYLIDQYMTEYHYASTVELVFTRGDDGFAPTGVVVAAMMGENGEHAIARGELDVTPPTLHPRAEPGVMLDDEYRVPLAETRTFLFSEPLPAPSDVLVAGSSVNAHVTYLERFGYLFGFELQGYLPSSTELTMELVDLAGNAKTASLPVVGLDIAPLVGDFEGDVEFLTDADLDGGYCGYGAALVIDTFDGPALSGSRAFLHARSTCASYFRVTRSAGATELKFDARLLDITDGGVAVTVWSYLPVGGSRFGPWQYPVWKQDAAFDSVVSTIESFSFPLPEEGDDFLVGISSHGTVLLDSLRSE